MARQISITIPEEAYDKLMKLKEKKHMNISSWISSQVQQGLDDIDQDEEGQ